MYIEMQALFWVAVSPAKTWGSNNKEEEENSILGWNLVVAVTGTDWESNTRIGTKIVL